MSRVLASLFFIASLASQGAKAAGEIPAPDPWAPAKRFVGTWSGVAQGEAGSGTVMRTYSFAMNGRYLEETNISTYPPQEKNKKGEVHEHRGFFSYDKASATLVLRQFHVESFVITYRLKTNEGNTFTFESESFENFSNTWKAREGYAFVSDDEFVETFELAPPGKPFKVYSRNHFKRVK